MNAEHLTTISHEGRFWDVYVEVADDGARPDRCRGRFLFSLAGDGDGIDPVRTGVILIEDSWIRLMERARDFDGRQLEALLRSALP